MTYSLARGCYMGMIGLLVTQKGGEEEDEESTAAS